MTSIVFPAVAPSEHPTILAGRFPHVEKRSTGGRVRRIGLSNVQLDGEITLTYSNIDTQQLLTLLAHWRQVRGTTLDFRLPAELFPSMSSSTRARLMATTWRHKEGPKVTDICGGQPEFLLHSLEFTIVAQPRRVASPVLGTAPELSLPVVPITAPGAQLRVAAVFAPGAAGIDEIKVPGAAWTIAPIWLPGAASTPGTSTAPGAAWAVSVEFTPGPTTTPSAALSISTSWATGSGSIGGVAPGAALAAGVVWAPGGASVSIVQAPGAALAASVAWAPGGASITGGTAPGATLALATGWQPGAAQSIGPGAALAVSVVWEPGIQFNRVALQIPGDGTNNSTSIVDVSSNALTITRHGSPVISTAASVNGGASVRFNAYTTDALSLDNSALALTTGDFWFEGRLKFLSNQFFTNFFVSFNHDSSSPQGSGSYLSFGQNSTKLRMMLFTPTTDNQQFYAAADEVTITLTDFQHYAAGRVNGELAVWVNGTLYQMTIPFIGGSKNIGTTRTIKSLGNMIHIGARRREAGYGGNGYDNGIDAYMDDFRFVKGTPPWGLANFTPPTGPHPTS